MRLPEEECERRRREAFRAKGMDYDAYKAELERRKEEAAERKAINVERAAYRPNHEDDIQFGRVPPDTAFSWA